MTEKQNYETLYKTDIIEMYAGKKGITKTEATERIDDIFEIIVSELVNERIIKLANFFNFFPSRRKAKPGKNPVTNEDMIIPETKTLVVKMTKPVKDRVQGKK